MLREGAGPRGRGLGSLSPPPSFPSASITCSWRGPPFPAPGGPRAGEARGGGLGRSVGQQAQGPASPFLPGPRPGSSARPPQGHGRRRPRRGFFWLRGGGEEEGEEGPPRRRENESRAPPRRRSRGLGEGREGGAGKGEGRWRRGAQAFGISSSPRPRLFHAELTSRALCLCPIMQRGRRRRRRAEQKKGGNRREEEKKKRGGGERGEAVSVAPEGAELVPPPSSLGAARSRSLVCPVEAGARLRGEGGGRRCPLGLFSPLSPLSFKSLK